MPTNNTAQSAAQPETGGEVILTPEDVKKWPISIRIGGWSLVTAVFTLLCLVWLISKKYTEMEQKVESFKQTLEQQKGLLDNKDQLLEDKIKLLRETQDRQQREIDSLKK